MITEKTMEKIAYFDNLPQKFREGDAAALAAFGRHIHWGYWQQPATADGSFSDFSRAAEALSYRMADTAGIKDGMSILDAGCGFGGTIATLNERFARLNLVGVNIDEQQVLRAREEVQALGANKIEFVCADACQLPFPDQSFDVVFALECIFAFPSRVSFFQEAKRVLRPGGKLTICDFLPIETIGLLWHWSEKWLKPLVGRTYGAFSIQFCTVSAYEKLGKNTGFSLVGVEDITVNTLPTYPVVNQLMVAGGDQETYWATKGLEIVSRLGLLKYMILDFQIEG